LGFEKNILCIGAGYVGGPTMAMIAYKCPQYKVVVVDIDKEKIKAWNSAASPSSSRAWMKSSKKCRGKNLFFSTEIEKGIENRRSSYVSSTLPQKPSGRAQAGQRICSTCGENGEGNSGLLGGSKVRLWGNPRSR